ncbi:hypothetical protein BDW74DRAFT_174891 [Aspergillus multicolor]|uniref:uncharacterized protein n=1 Tax=Aspergillus multicolor TaxID=41759 RepID=UPI003CCE1AA7
MTTGTTPFIRQATSLEEKSVQPVTMLSGRARVWISDLRHHIGNNLTPLCELLEAKIRSKDREQRFRRLQHRLFGLSEVEVSSLEIYFTCWETMREAVQRDEWLTRRQATLRDKMQYSVDDGPTMTFLQAELGTVTQDIQRNEMICDSTTKLLRGVTPNFCHTPIYRTFRQTVLSDTCLHSAQLQKLCAEARGCCRRACGCCFKPRESRHAGPLVGGFHGHCTPACACCTEHAGEQKPANKVKSARELEINLKPAKTDTLGKRFINGLVWGIGDTR